MKGKGTCCFIGHRTVENEEYLKEEIFKTAERLILDGVDTFFFGSRSDFDALCLSEVTLLKEKHPQITRIYVRAEYPHIDEEYTRYLLESYDETFFPKRLERAGRAVYVERNFEMIDRADVCVFYCKEESLGRRSGTEIAYEYAKRREKRLINLFSPKNSAEKQEKE